MYAGGSDEVDAGLSSCCPSLSPVLPYLIRNFEKLLEWRKGVGRETGRIGRDGEREGIRAGRIDGGGKGAGLPAGEGGGVSAHPGQHGQGETQGPRAPQDPGRVSDLPILSCEKN